MTAHIYLFFNGNCEEAMNFYKDALHGEIISISRYGEAPMGASDAYKDKVLNGVLKVGESLIYFSDSSEGQRVTTGDEFSVALNFESADETDAAFAAISAGGNITMPLQDTFWNARFGMCTDKFGIKWMFNYDKPKV